jgi:tetratricopeptide (TPR) repeat protein/predicted Ser/Thr protein kinase
VHASSDPDGDTRPGKAAVAAPALPRGTCVGRYVVLEKLGQGGMGVVYKAYDPELDRPVALKLLSIVEDRADSMADRLRREAQALARLSHPNVIAVHDVGTFGRYVFIAMEFVEGQTLTAWLASQPGRREIISAFVAAGEGLSAAHRAGLVHRDFKPDNCMVGRDGRVRVLDFGLARVASDAPTPHTEVPADGTGTTPPPADGGATPPADTPSDSQRSARLLLTPLTQAGAIVGTPRFMAPEQHLGAAADERADQFSFCLSLYHALYGVFPFTGHTREEVIQAVLQGRIDEPPPGATVPRRLRRVLLRGLSPRPADRHPTMGALLLELTADPSARRRKWLRGASLVVLGVAALGGYRALKREQSSLCHGAERRLTGVWDQARRAAMGRAFAASGVAYADGALAGAISLLDRYASAWAGMHVESCEATRVRGEQSEELLDLRTQCLNKRLEELRAVTDLLVNADAKLVQRSVTMASGLGAIEECADAVALREAVRRPSDPKARAALSQLETEVARVAALGSAGQHREAARRGSALLPAVREAHYRPLEAELQIVISKAQRFGESAAAIESAYAGALAAVEGHDDARAARSWAYIAFLCSEERRAAEAHRALQVTEALLERAHHPPRPEAAYLLALGDILDDEGKPDEALAALERSIAVYEKLRDAGPNELANALSDYAVVLEHQDRPEEALRAETRALAIWEKLLGRSHPTLLISLRNSGKALLRLGRLDEAEAFYERARAIDLKIYGPDSADVGVDLVGLANVRSAARRFAEALALANQALAILTHKQEHLGDGFAALARAQLGLDRVAEAVRSYRRALDEMKSSPYTAELQLELVGALGRAGDREGARAQATRARAAAAATGPKSTLAQIDAWLAKSGSPR